MATLGSLSAACSTCYGRLQPVDLQRRIACRFSFLNATSRRNASLIKKPFFLHRDETVFSRLVVSALPDDLFTTVTLNAAIATVLSFGGFRAFLYFKMQYIIAAMLGKYVPRGGCKVLDMDIHEGRNLYYYPSDMAKVVAVTDEKNRGAVMNQGIMASVVTSALEVQEDPSIAASKDLLIIGPGVLGKLVAGIWMKEFSGCSVVGQTSTTNHHGELQSLGITPSLKGNQSEQGFPFVVFCAPPSGSEDYAGELRLAAKQWNGQGVFLFTSSSAVYDCSDNGDCDEDTPIVNVGRSPRTDVLLRAEQEVLQVGGTVVRLAGLYTKERGPHAYWAKKGIVDARPDHILNLIHYEDAASLCVAILRKGFRKEVFMGCDNHPLSRQEVMDVVNDSGKFADKFEAFTGTDGPLGKKMNCNRTRARTGWQPKYASFADFVRTLAA